MKRTMLPLLLAATGCVSAGTYDALKRDHDATMSALEDRNRALDESEKRVKQLLTAQTSLDASLNEARAESMSLQERVSKLEADLAAVVKDKSSLQASVSEMTAALAELQRRKAEADKRIAEFRSLLAKFKDLIDAGRLRVRIVEGRMVVVLNTDVLFASGSANLSKDGRAAVAEVAGLLASIPDKKFQIEGHTDNVPIATAQYPSNWDLAAARALNVLKAMVDAGLPGDRISAASFGESKPASTNETADGRKANRRIEIIIVPDLSTLPGFEELQRVERGA